MGYKIYWKSQSWCINICIISYTCLNVICVSCTSQTNNDDALQSVCRNATLSTYSYLCAVWYHKPCKVNEVFVMPTHTRIILICRPSSIYAKFAREERWSFPFISWKMFTKEFRMHFIIHYNVGTLYKNSSLIW